MAPALSVSSGASSEARSTRAALCLGTEAARSERDTGRRLVDSILHAFAVRQVVLTEPDEVTASERARMAKAGRLVSVIRRPVLGDCLDDVSHPTDPMRPIARECSRADGLPKFRFPRKSEAKKAAAVLRARGEIVHVYRCGTCGHHHVGHYVPRNDDVGIAS